MNGNDLINAMTDVDDRHILAAEKKRRKPLFIGMAAIAATVAIVIGAAAVLRPRGHLPENLPALQVEQMIVGGMGDGGASYNETTGGSAWEFDMIPVFRSETAAPDREKMMGLLENAANTLGLNFSEMEINDMVPTAEDEQQLREQFAGYGAPEEEIQRMMRNQRIYSEIAADGNKLYITVNSAYCVSIVWRDNVGLELPEDVKPSADASYDELDRAGRYVLENYPALFGFEDPVQNESFGKDGKITAHSVSYCENGSDEERFVNGELKNADIRFSDDGNVKAMHIYTDAGLTEIENYPIITPEKAEELLYNGNYSTNASYEIVGGEEIVSAELFYRSGIGYECVMPFYRMTVRLPEEAAEEYGGVGFEYCDYYVPAVNEKYIEEMPYKQRASAGVPEAIK